MSFSRNIFVGTFLLMGMIIGSLDELLGLWWSLIPAVLICFFAFWYFEKNIKWIAEEKC